MMTIAHVISVQEMDIIATVGICDTVVLSVCGNMTENHRGAMIATQWTFNE